MVKNDPYAKWAIVWLCAAHSHVINLRDRQTEAGCRPGL